MKASAALNTIGVDEVPASDPRDAEIAKVQAVLRAARAKQATLVQLAEAYDIAERLRLGVTQIELREHLAYMIKPLPDVVVVARSPLANLIIGVIAGFLVHMLMAARGPSAAQAQSMREAAT